MATEITTEIATEIATERLPATTKVGIMPHRASLRRLSIVLVLVVCSAALASAQAVVKKPVSYDAYDSWKSIRGTEVSRDGTWLVYALVAEEGDGELVARNLKTGVEHRYPRGERPAITPDGRFVVFTIVPPNAEVEQAKKDKKKPEDQPKSGLGIMTLATGAVTAVDRVKSFELPEESSAVVAYLKEPPATTGAREEKPAAEPPAAKPEGGKKDRKHEPGTELVVRQLATGQETSIPEATEYEWNRDGSRLAYAVSSKTPDDDGAFVRAADGATVALARGKGVYTGLTFDRSGGELAFVSDRGAYDANPPTFTLYFWRAADGQAAALVSSATTGMPSGWSVSQNGTLEFSKDGGRLFLGTAPTPRPEPGPDAPEPVQVDIWNWKDPLLQPMQKVRAEEERKRSYRAVVSLSDRRFTQLATADMPEVELADDASVGLGASPIPYLPLISWDGSYNDFYTVSVADGTRTRILEKAYFDATLSPGAQYVAYFDDRDDNWYTYRIRDGRRVNLTATLGVHFEVEDWDTPSQPRPYGLAGWTSGDADVLLYDRYDIWAVRPDGTNARRLTGGMGRAERLVFRYQRLDPDEKAIPTGHPLLLRTTDDRTKASGFYRVAFAGQAAPQKIVMLDKAFGGPIKAKDADVLVYTLSRFEEFPDLWTSDATFADMAKVSDANPQQKDYLWGTSELIDYVNADGKTLQAILTKPEHFDPAKKYPLMVYIYEKLSQGLHRYVPPAPGTSINVTRYVSNGYVVLEPDIVYDDGYPGQSAEKCVVPAVLKVLSMGFVDPARVGIQGHSWGGYQITYLITRTNIFRAVEAGAAVPDMISAYGGIRWGSGMSRAFQVRKDPEPHRRAAVGAVAAVHRELAPLLGGEGADAVPHHPQRRRRRGAVVPGDRVLQRHAAAAQGGVPVRLQRREARPPAAREPEGTGRCTSTSTSTISCSGSPCRSGWRRACRTSSGASAT